MIIGSINVAIPIRSEDEICNEKDGEQILNLLLLNQNPGPGQRNVRNKSCLLTSGLRS